MIPTTDREWDLVVANGQRVDPLAANELETVRQLAPWHAMKQSLKSICRAFHYICVAMDSMTREHYRMTSRQDFDKYCSLHNDSILSYHTLSFLAYHTVAITCDILAWNTRSNRKLQIVWCKTMKNMLVAIEVEIDLSRAHGIHMRDRFLPSQLHHHIMDKYRRLVSMREEVAEQPLKHMLGNDVFRVVIAYL
jgi:hypothetical protein